MATDPNSGAPKRSRRTPTTPEEREKKLQNMAYDLAEEQLEKKTASSQLMTLLIKGGGVREQLEMEKMKTELRLANAKIEQLASQVRLEASIEAAMEAFRSYQGTPDYEVDD